MSLKFTALEIGSGDAFLLEDGDRKILFDAGGSQDLIVRLLKKKKIKKIDLAICSHNDKDHSNGFLGLLKSDIAIDEIWLPANWASILHSIKHDPYCFMELFCHFGYFNRKYHELEGREIKLYSEEYVPVDSFQEELTFFENEDLEYYCAMMEEYYKDHQYRGEAEEWEMIKNNYYRNKKQFPRHINDESCRFNDGTPDFCKKNCAHKQWCWRYHEYTATDILINLEKIIEIARAAHKKSPKIKWFEPIKSCCQNKVDYGFVALNSIKSHRIKEIDHHPLAFLCALYTITLTKENEYSLVFEFHKSDIPVVRFSADSDSTCQSKKPYCDNIIVTAPHHGSEANKGVYGAIDNDNVIWVRSDRKISTRPCKEYKTRKERYCLACKHRKPSRKEICFEYDESKKQWICNSGERCVCQP